MTAAAAWPPNPEQELRKLLMFAAFNGFVAVLAGAMGTHALRATLSAQALGWIATAERYQMWHALALGVVVALAAQKAGLDAPMPHRLAVAAALFAAGIVLFSGSLYVLALTDWRPVAMVTPVGGLALMAGWIVLAIHGLSRRD